MGLNRRSFGRFRERTWLALVAFRQRVQHEGLAPWAANKPVRRVTVLWLSSVALLITISFLQLRSLRPFYMQATGQPGGTYTEGIVGSITTINPILTESGANADAARLIFSGLTRYSRAGEIEGDLASSWTVSPNGLTYTFSLRPNVAWHDGQTLTADDVAYTISLIQNPDVHSPMASAWQGVIVTTPNPQTVIVTLPVRYDAFINSTTVGILPKHVLQGTPADGLRASSFNQQPVGTGPFKINDFDTDSGSVSLQANTKYFRGKPKLDSIVLKVYASQAALQSAFRKHQVTGMARAANSTATSYGSGVDVHALRIPEEVALFMRTKSPALSDIKVRQAIAAAVDRKDIIKSTLHNDADPLVVPALKEQLAIVQNIPVPDKNITNAKALLGDKKLTLSLVTADTEDYRAVAARLARELGAIGIKVDVQAYDFTTLQQNYIKLRNYDLLLYGLNAGVDLDPYPYWHSSQIKSPGLNVSQYTSTAADKALESARATADNRVRLARLSTFLGVWAKDAPAVMLYSPQYLYVTKDDVRGIVDGQLMTAADRYYDVQNWTVHSKLVPRINL